MTILQIFPKPTTTTGIQCNLIWKPSGFGNLLKFDVHPGVKNSVAKMQVAPQGDQPEYVGGYLDEVDGNAYGVDEQENIIKKETYLVI